MYAYVRFETGDEMSRRKKFAFITWIGPSVSPLKKAKVSTDKAFVKEIVRVSAFLKYCVLNITLSLSPPSLSFSLPLLLLPSPSPCLPVSPPQHTFLCVLPQDFGKEFLADEKGELKYEKILGTLEKASGAAYGTGR